MGNFLSLVAGENKKIWKQKTAVVLLVIFFILNAALALIFSLVDKDIGSSILSLFGSDSNIMSSSNSVVVESEDSGVAVKDEDYIFYSDEQNLEMLKEQLNNPDINSIEEYSIKTEINVLERSIAINNYKSENNIGSTKVSDAWLYTQLSMSALSMLAIIGVFIIGASTVASESSDGTIKLLLTRPFKRWKILTSKFIAALLYGLFMYVLSFIFSFVIGGIIYGFGGMDVSVVACLSPSNVFSMNIIAYILFKFALSFTQVILLLSMVFLVSCLFKSRALAVGISLFVYFVASNVVSVVALLGVDILKYLIFFNMDLSTYLIMGPTYPGLTFTISAISMAVHFIIFMAASYLVFSRRDA